MTDEPPIDESPGLAGRLQAIEATVASIGRAVEGHSDWLTDLQRWVSSCVNAMVVFGADTPRGSDAALGAPPDVIGRLLTWTEIQTVMSWIRDAADVVEGPLVSVTIATRNRPGSLGRAISSVLSQSYSRLELIVVDDSDGPETAELLKGIDDPRLRALRTAARRGPSAAYNAGLESVQGDLVAFLDDDNVMHPDWLRSIVWAFNQRPDTDALYGGRILEDTWTTGNERAVTFPTFQFSRYDRRRHERGSSIDRNVLAMRASRKALRYDERLRFAVDWDYTLRLFAQATPLALPVIACYYGTSGPGRISERPDIEVLRLIRSRAHCGRPLSIHAHFTGSEPGALAAELEELIAAGAKVTLSASMPHPAVDGVGAWRLDVEQALDDAQPDLVLIDSLAAAADAVELLAARELPFALTSTAANVPEAASPNWIGPLDRRGPLEPALREALTRWLYERTAGWTQP